MLGTNPVVVRRTMAGLRDAGYVRSEKGHGGGWAIVADLKKVSLLDIHRAVGGPRILAIGHEHPSPDCAVAQIVNEALEDFLREAEALLVERLGAVRVAKLARDFDERFSGTATSKKWQVAGLSQRPLASSSDTFFSRSRIGHCRGDAMLRADSRRVAMKFQRPSPPSSRGPTRRDHPKPTSWRQAGLPRDVFDGLVCTHWGSRHEVGAGTCQGFTNR